MCHTNALIYVRISNRDLVTGSDLLGWQGSVVALVASHTRGKLSHERPYATFQATYNFLTSNHYLCHYPISDKWWDLKIPLILLVPIVFMVELSRFRDRSFYCLPSLHSNMWRSPLYRPYLMSLPSATQWTPDNPSNGTFPRTNINSHHWQVPPSVHHDIFTPSRLLNYLRRDALFLV